MQPRHVISGAVLALLAVATLVLYPVPHYSNLPPLSQCGYESLALASSLAHHRGFADPFGTFATGPSALLAPAFPAFLAFIISHAGNEQAAYTTMAQWATLIVVFQICLMPLLARYLGLGFYTGVGASVLWLVARVPREIVWEQNYTGVLIMVLTFLAYAALRRKLQTVWLVVCAALWGGLILLCPVALLALAAWVVLVHLAGTQTRVQTLVLVLVPVLMLAPWTLRNYHRFHRLVLVRDNLGLELEISNNSCASFSFEINQLNGCFAQHHPNENFGEVSRVAELGEVAYNQQRLHIAVGWIEGHPGEFAALTAKRVAAFWLPSLLESEQAEIRDPEAHSVLRDAIVSLASIAALAGLVVMWRRNRAACLIFVVWLTTFPVIYYIAAYNERYRIPVQWAILLPACYAVRQLLKRLLPGHSERGEAS